MKRLLMISLLSVALLTGCSSKASQHQQVYEISETQAKMTALSQSHLSENDCKSILIEKDIEEGRNIFEVELRNDSHKYSYWIDRNSGEIIKKNIEQLSKEVSKEPSKETSKEPVVVVPENTNPQEELLSYQDALQLVLKKMPQIQPEMIEMELDKENGQFIYEGDFHYNSHEYEFEINAKTGNFLKWHVEKDD